MPLNKMEQLDFNSIKKKYSKFYISPQLSEKVNKLLTESCSRSGGKINPKVVLFIKDHLNQFQSISILNRTVFNAQQAKDVAHDYITRP